MINLCGPAIIYLIFSVTQIIIDIFKGLYNTAFMKGIVMVMVTLLLHILCQKGLSVVSWIIVFIPFIMMTVIVSMLLYIFGLDATTGKLNYKCDNSNTNCGKNITIDALGNVVIYDPEYNSKKNPVYYQSPNIIIPNPINNDNNKNKNKNNNKNTVLANQPIMWKSSSPAYQS
jgi:hypothetical protein